MPGNLELTYQSIFIGLSLCEEVFQQIIQPGREQMTNLEGQVTDQMK